jgi:hypothetical protein
MIKKIISGALVFLFICPCFSPNAAAEGNTEKYLGKRLSCLQTVLIKDSYVLDDQTILFETDHGVVYINRLPASCHGLKVADGYSYDTSIDKLCKQGIIRLLESSYGATNACGLGEFIEMKGPENIRAAIKILKDEGILKILIKEGAFKAHSSTENR